MGLFLSMSGIADSTIDEVVSAISNYVLTKPGTIQKCEQQDVNSEHLIISEGQAKNVSILYPKDFLKEDELTLAFVGEYSRGKTELINSLFFSEFGQRMLPSQAGRTTMCPTELFYDQKSGKNYLKLLPIETRKEDVTLAQLSKQAEKWTTIELDTSSPDSMKLSLDEVAKTHIVSIEEAKDLGFHETMLDHDPTNY